MIKVDMHMHSKQSDGSQSTTELVQMLSQKCVRYAVLTDHDTVSGVSTFMNACQESCIISTSGMELSTVDGEREVHMLGYGMRHEDADFLKEMLQIQQFRTKRNQEILRLLQKNNIDLPNRLLQSQTNIGRKQIADAMVYGGFAYNREDAFHQWLAVGKRAYVPCHYLTTSHAIAMIQKFGGIAVLAHPMRLNLEKIELENLIAKLKEYGLNGIEAYYVSHTNSETRVLSELANRLQLVMSCGSDYHNHDQVAALGNVPHALHTEDLHRLFFTNQ